MRSRTPKAARQLRKLDKQMQGPIRDAVTRLAMMPDCQNVKALTNHLSGYRLRTGNCRVLFDWDGDVRIVEINEVSNEMNVPINIQVINGPDGKPAYVVIPYEEYRKSLTGGTIPHEVVSATVDGATPVRAWREYLRLTQAEVAQRLGIAQSSYAKQESSDALRRTSMEKIASALGIALEQLDF